MVGSSSSICKLQLLAAVASPVLLLLVLLLLPTFPKLSWRQPCQCESGVRSELLHVTDRSSDIEWLKQQVPLLSLSLSLSTSASWMAPRKGINLVLATSSSSTFAGPLPIIDYSQPFNRTTSRSKPSVY